VAAERLSLRRSRRSIQYKLLGRINPNRRLFELANRSERFNRCFASSIARNIARFESVDLQFAGRLFITLLQET
jgi:hypothetical protein